MGLRRHEVIYRGRVSALPHLPKPPSKHLALWIAIPVIGAVALIGSLFTDDDPPAVPPPPAKVGKVATASAAPSPSRSVTVTPSPTRPAATAATTDAPNRPPARTTTTTRAAQVYYRNCDAARAAGAAPLYRGEPGYRSGLDRDGDGVACDVRR